jgi:hypothetical protein
MIIASKEKEERGVSIILSLAHDKETAESLLLFGLSR